MARALSPEQVEQQAVLVRLWDEFARLNAAHFNNTLTLREIKLSTRKQYGGYYRPSESLIVLSWQAYKEHGWDETLETFRHEVAHIVHPNHRRARPRNLRPPSPRVRTAGCVFCRTAPSSLE